MSPCQRIPPIPTARRGASPCTARNNRAPSAAIAQDINGDGLFGSEHQRPQPSSTSMTMTDDPFEMPHGDEFEPDTPAAAMARLRDRFRAIHPQAAAIITAHAALELEVDQVLRRFVARPNKLPRLSI